MAGQSDQLDFVHASDYHIGRVMMNNIYPSPVGTDRLPRQGGRQDWRMKKRSAREAHASREGKTPSQRLDQIAAARRSETPESRRIRVQRDQRSEFQERNGESTTRNPLPPPLPSGRSR